MAGTLTASVGVSFQSGTTNIASFSRSSGNFSVTTTGSKFNSQVQNIGTVEETLDLGDCASIGYVQLHNLDTSNYVEVGSATGVYSVKLLAGQWALLPWDGAAVYAKANTSAVNLEYVIVEV